jgi:hypothetical protein
MVDELKDDANKMESFVGNDPQSSFKLLRHLLDQKIPHRIPHEQVTVEMAKIASDLSLLYDAGWSDINYRYRQRGRQGWVWDLAGFILATGWYSVFAMMAQDGSRCIAEIWNPATVFPNWDDELAECAHVETLSPTGLQRLASRNGWNVSAKSNIKMYDYWRLGNIGEVYNSIVLGSTLVKPETLETRFYRIPIFVSPVGGLPDTGIISGDAMAWRAEVGMSSVSTNENIYKYWNKWWSLSMQALRDVVQSRIKEKSRGKPIVKPEDVFKRGAIFRMTPEEDVSFMNPPPIPVELRATQLDLEAMMQRGGPSWSMFGSAAGNMTAYVMSQTAASTNQIAKPYHQGIIDCMTDIDNFWLYQIRRFGYKPYGKELPKGLPEDVKVSAEYEIRIPGDLIQRATVARMLDPEFRLSNARVMDELFPEVKSPLLEKAQVRADAAERHPLHATIVLIQSFREQAKILSTAGDKVGAGLYEKAANSIEASMNLQEEQAPETAPLPPRKRIGMRTEAVPPSGTERPPTPLV